jgi:hypothetical protein
MYAKHENEISLIHKKAQMTHKCHVFRFIPLPSKLSSQNKFLLNSAGGASHHMVRGLQFTLYQV